MSAAAGAGSKFSLKTRITAEKSCRVSLGDDRLERKLQLVIVSTQDFYQGLRVGGDKREDEVRP